jgi:putative transposase
MWTKEHRARQAAFARGRRYPTDLTDRTWEAKLTPCLSEELRRKRRGRIGRSWYVDETYLRVGGRWCSLYRAIDRNGNLVDVLLSERRDLRAARAFFRSAKRVTGITPDRVTTDGHDSYPRAIRTELGNEVRHRTSRYLNNRLEQDHRGIKGRYRPMRGFKCPRSAARFCRGHDELRGFFRLRSRHHQHVPADRRRLLLLRRTVTVSPENRNRAGYLGSRLTTHRVQLSTGCTCWREC